MACVDRMTDLLACHLMQRRRISFCCSNASMSLTERIVMGFRSLMRRLDTFFDFTSMIGFRFMHSRHALWFRFMACFLISVSLGLSVYQSIDRLSAFVRNPIVINIDQKDESKQHLPLIYICSDSQYRILTGSFMPVDVTRLLLQQSADPGDYEKLDMINDDLNDLMTIRQQLVEVGIDEFNAKRAEFMSKINGTSKRMINYLPKIGSNLNLQPLQYLTEIADNLTSRIDFEYFAQMQSRWDDCWRGNLLNKTAATNSTSIAADYSITLCEVNKTINQLLTIKTLDWPNLMESAEGNNKDIVLYCTWLGRLCHITSAWTSRGKCLEISAPTDGSRIANVTGNKAAINIMVDTRPLETDSVVQILLRNPENLTDTALSGDALDVKAGSAATFSISRVTKISRYGSNCGSRPLHEFTNYTYEACLWEKTDLANQKLCECRWYFSPHNRNTLDSSGCPHNCYDTMYEVDRMNYPLADDLNDFLPPEWSERVNAAIDRHANQARIVELDSGSRKKLKSLIEEMFNLYLELFYEFWNDESCDPSLTSCSSRGKAFIPFWTTETDDIDGVLKSSLFTQYPIGFSSYHKEPSKSPCSYLQDINSTLISDELLGVLMAYNNSLNSRREAKNGSNEAIDVALSTYDQLMSDNEMNSTNDTLHTTLKVLQLLTDDINRMQSSCINNTNITDYHYCFYFYNSEVLQMTSAADVASFNAIVADSAQKPGAYDSLQKQFRLSATQGLPTVLAAAQLKKNFLAQREAFEAKNLWQSAISPFLNWLNSELYVTKACPSVVGICTNIKQRSKDINLASTLTFNSSAFNLADFVRYYSVDAHYEVLAKMITDLSANLSGLKTSYSNFLSSLKWSAEDRFGSILTHRADDHVIADLFNCTNRQLDAIERLLRMEVLSESPKDGIPWLKSFSNLINNEAMDVYKSGAPYIKKSIATINIYYRSFSVQNVVQTSTYNVWTFLSDIGGTMGLYLGATLLTFFEVIAFFVHGEETITRANMDARQRAPEAHEPKLNGHTRSVRWEQTGWPRYITFNDPSAPTINRWLSRRRSS